MPDGLTKECLGCCHVPSLAEPKVNSLTGLVHGSIQVRPLAAYLDIGFVHSPGSANRLAKPVPVLDELRDISPNPAQNGRMGKIQSAFSHHLDQIAIAQLETEVPTHT